MCIRDRNRPGVGVFYYSRCLGAYRGWRRRVAKRAVKSCRSLLAKTVAERGVRGGLIESHPAARIIRLPLVDLSDASNEQDRRDSGRVASGATVFRRDDTGSRSDLSSSPSVKQERDRFLP